VIEYRSVPAREPSEGISLRDVLTLDIVQRTDPELLHGEHLLDRPVRWVHTSELAQVPFLLKGGELLLTSGLGLANQGRAGQSGYVHQLADKNVAALALELGWYFHDVPDALLDAARERDLPLIALRRVIPFVEITEEIQARIVHRHAARLRLEHKVQSQLNDVLLRQEGLSGIVTLLSELLARPVVLRTCAGQTAAVAGAVDGGGDAVARAPVRLLDEDWGALEVLGPAESFAPDVLRAALDHGPTAIALVLLRDREAVPLRRRLTAELVSDLLAGRPRPLKDLETRASLAGLRPARRRRLIAFAVGDFPPEDAGLALLASESSATALGGGLVAQVNDIVFGVIDGGSSHDVLAQAEQLFAEVKAAMFQRGASRSPLVALGPVAHGLDALGRSLREAESTLELSREIQPGRRAVTARGMALDRLLTRLADDPDELPAYVESELGELISYDAAHSTALVQTLWAHLTSGHSKSELSRELHLRRQSLYRRLSKIEQLIGGGLDDPERRVALILALKAHDLLRRRGSA
jgi:purine catabolism regulator